MVGVRGDPIITATPRFIAFLEINHMAIPPVYAYYVNSKGLYWNCFAFAQ